MRRHFLDDDALPRFMQARIDAIRTIADIVEKEGCAFVVSAGDVFDSNHLDRRTVGRALEALSTVPCPVFLLPGNHDPLDAGSVYHSTTFTERKPDNVIVLDATEPVEVIPGIEIVGVPWFTKTTRTDLVVAACRQLKAASEQLRVCVAHGIVDDLSPDKDRPDLISLANMKKAIQEGVVHFIALGDRHSVTKLDERIWYSGAPEATDYREDDSGKVLLVELSDDACSVTPHAVGQWRFVRKTLEFSSPDDVDEAKRQIDEMPNKDTTILKLSLRGSLNLEAKARLDAYLAEAEDLFGALEFWERHSDLIVLPDTLDIDALGLSGFARTSVEELKTLAEGDDDEALTARDALALLYRLTIGAQA
jgi:DNA repair exonuclease SbcCD nuclease subunit